MNTDGVEELRIALTRGELGAVELLEHTLREITARDGGLHAFMQVDAEGARAAAASADAAIRRGDTAPLLGIPLAVKDNLDAAGLDTTCGSPRLARRATVDALVIARVRRAGAVIVGRTNMHELAYGATNRNPFYGDCCNAWDPARISGGSSGGSAVAVAAGLVPASLGSDTGGSVRIPAALNGVSGLRASGGRIPTDGLAPISWSFDTAGPLARRVRDVALLDAVLADDAPAPAAASSPSLDGLRARVLSRALEAAAPAVAAAVEDAIRALRDMGARIEEVDAGPDLAAWAETMAVMVQAEAFAIHRGLLERDPEAVSDDVRDRLELGRAVTGAEYALARERARGFRAEAAELCEGHSVVLLPTTTAVAPPRAGAELLPTTRALTALTAPWSLVGTPALSVPCGTAEGLPAGLQIVGAHGCDRLVLQAGAAYQQATDWHLRAAPEREASQR